MIIRYFDRHAAALAWLWSELFPRCITLAVLGGMVIMTLITIGESPLGPVADLSLPDPCHVRLLVDYSSSFDPGPDLCPQAGRVDQDHLGVLAVQP